MEALLLLRKAEYLLSEDRTKCLKTFKESKGLFEEIRRADLGKHKKHYNINYLFLLNRIFEINHKYCLPGAKESEAKVRKEAIEIAKNVDLDDFDAVRITFPEVVRVLGYDPNLQDNKQYILEVISDLKNRFDAIEQKYSSVMPRKYWLRLGNTYLASLPKIVGFIEDDISYSLENNPYSYWEYVVKASECIERVKRQTDSHKDIENIEKISCYILLVSVIMTDLKPDLNLFSSYANNGFFKSLGIMIEEKNSKETILNYIIKTCEWLYLVDDKKLITLRYLAEAYFIKSSLSLSDSGEEHIQLTTSQNYMKEIKSSSEFSSLTSEELFDYYSFHLKLSARFDDDLSFVKYVKELERIRDINDHSWDILRSSQTLRGNKWGESISIK